MGIVPEAAPEIDRLVLSVNRSMQAKHGSRLLELARERGLETLELLPHFGDFLLAGRLTRDLALLRMRYWPPERVLGRLDELEQRQLARQGECGLVATPAMQPLLAAVAAAQAEEAAAAWGHHRQDVATATRVAGTLVEGASDDHVVATVHRSLPEPTEPCHRLHHRLVTLRYIRQHDHAMAWLARELSAPEMVVMTTLWQGGEVEEPSDGLDRLRALGLADASTARLTDEGRALREAIEADTNERAHQTFDVLDDEAAVQFLTALRRLPAPAEL